MKPLGETAVAAVGVLLMTGALLTGCSGSNNPTTPTGTTDPVSIPDFTITDLVAGTGIAAANGNFLTVEFTGWLYDDTLPDNKGTQFDATAGTPITIVLGVGQVIPGWDLGLVGMRVGGERRLVLPPNLGFGTQGPTGIPPNASLVFEVELLRVDEAPEFTIIDLVVGTGAEVVSGNTLSVEFTGWLYNPTKPDNKGTQFDSTNGSPSTVLIGAGVVIAGWDQGLLGMRVGGQRRLIIPPELAFGSSGSAGTVILPGATLVFDIELLSIS
ncbi:MAG: FKBP-type peptidyl-prolyl cis-trans isomerase [Vicinamibacterales bacterium]|jgi:peptidylprolyl isomerase|nr:FKBP-type peptidyl-prolyl cis-trans isomerase [Vicinamibacterales bacterium]